MIANAAVDETYAVGSMPRVGESLVGELRSRDLGGKGANVATVLGRCGVPTALVATIGDDERGAFVRERLGREPVELALQVRPDLPTDLSIVYRTPDGDNAIVTTVATTRSLDVARALDAMDRLAPGGTLVLQGNLERRTSVELVEAARARSARIAFNPSPWMPWASDLLARVHAVFVNEGEALAATGAEGERAVATLLEAGPEAAVLTRGARGALLGARGRPAVEVAAVPTSILDTTGAGDTYLAVALASAARRGTGLDAAALEHAARASAITVSRPGTLSAFPSAAELAAILESTPPAPDGRQPSGSA